MYSYYEHTRALNELNIKLLEIEYNRKRLEQTNASPFKYKTPEQTQKWIETKNETD